MMSLMPKVQRGFTIVELLIVIVVIGILAAITMISYNGIQGKANDAAIQSDLSNANSLLSASYATSGAYPVDETALSLVGLKFSKGSYGKHLVDGGTGYLYNVLYCRTIPSYEPSDFAIIASSRSGNVYSVRGAEGQVKKFPTASWTGSGWGTICPAILNVVSGNSAAGIWIYENSIWKSWVNN